MQLAKIRKSIDAAARAYYSSGDSIITDAQYDELIGELRQLCPDDPRLAQVGPLYSAKELRDKVEHSIPMGSLDNTEGGIGGFADWYDKVSAKVGEQPALCISHKYDGNSAAAYYVNGQLDKVVTRGNGIAGDNVTANAVMWQHLPTSLHEPLTIAVRGEAILPKAAFDKLNADGSHNNPRNLCAGIIGRKSDGSDNRHIEFHAFNSDAPLATLSDRLKHAKVLGFTPVWHKVVTKNVIDEVVGTFMELEDAPGSEGLGGRGKLPYEIDGVVVAVDTLETQDALTENEQDKLRPKHSRAIKFTTLKATARVIGVQITLGHTGALVPTLDLTPTRMGGVTIDSALVNNWNAASTFPSAAHIAVGDEIELERAGDVIPKTRSVVSPVFRNPEDGFVGTLAQFAAKYGEILFEERDSLLPGTEHCPELESCIA